MRQYQSNKIKIHTAMWHTLNSIGISIDDVVRVTRLSPAILLKKTHVTSEQFFALWDSFADISGNPGIGIQFARALKSDQMDPSFFAAYIARDYREALYRVARFKRLSAPELIRFEEATDYCTVTVEWMNNDKQMPDPLVDVTLAALLELGNNNTREGVKAKSVSVTRKKGQSDHLEAYFNCDVHYQAKHNTLTLDREALDYRFETYNEELLNIIAPQLENELDSLLRRPSYTSQVKWLISQCLSSGCPKIALISKELGLSVRTLQRRITEEGHTYQDLINQSRHESAKSYLAQPELSVFEIAILLGYENQNSFYRAFKEWEGVPPSSWREQQLPLTSKEE